MTRSLKMMAVHIRDHDHERAAGMVVETKKTATAKVGVEVPVQTKNINPIQI
jgi:hypothetical protein